SFSVMRFSGSMRLRIGEAVHLQPTSAATRHAALFGKATHTLDPYIVVKVDEYRVGQTRTKPRTSSPTYNEEFDACVSAGSTLELAVFHDAPIGYDQFIANCTIRFQDLMETTSTEETFEGWVSATKAPCMCTTIQTYFFRNTNLVCPLPVHLVLVLILCFHLLDSLLETPYYQPCASTHRPLY
uniref:C2 domain-containing protein n=1 Tax=Astyanax mexicanus TaxID=7994 RepID=A0A3B1IYG9_ASTMX